MLSSELAHNRKVGRRGRDPVRKPRSPFVGRKAAVTGDSGIPEFLRRKRGEKKTAAPLPNTIDLTRARPDVEGTQLNEGLAMYGLRVPAVGESGETGFRVDEGVIPRHWARESSTVMELARRLATKKEQFERHSAAREENVEKSKAEKAKRKAAMYRGMISLGDLLTELGASAPSVGRARKAVERAHMIHRKFHFGPKEVEGARKLLREMPAAGPRPGASGASTPSVRQTAPAPDGFIRLHVEANPHKEGTEQHRRMAVLMSYAGKSAQDFLAANGCKLKLKHAMAQSWVTLEKTAGAPAPAGRTPTPRKTPEAKERAPAVPSKPAYDVKAMANADGKVRARARALPGKKVRGKK